MTAPYVIAVTLTGDCNNARAANPGVFAELGRRTTVKGMRRASGREAGRKATGLLTPSATRGPVVVGSWNYATLANRTGRSRPNWQ